MSEYQHQLEFTVRDYECDLQGIVNNSVYQNYLEHARHEFMNSVGVSFSDLFEKGIVAVVARVELAYKNSLRSKDKFMVRTRFEHKGVKYIFYQDIYRLPDEKVCLKGIVTTVTTVNGRLTVSHEIANALSK